MAAPYDDESLASTAGSPPSLPTSSSVPAAGPPGSQPLGAGGVALEDNKPAYPSPLRDSTTVRDLDPTSQAVPASSSSTAADSAKTASSAGASAGEHKPTTVENVLSAISGAAVTAPVAAAEAISAKASELLQSSKGPASSGAQTTSATASKALDQASAQAGVLASTASEKLAGFSQVASERLTGLVKQAQDSLPPQLANMLPAGTTGDTAAGKTVHSEPVHDITSETRETTSAPIVESQQGDRVNSVSKPLVPGEPGSSAASSSPTAAPGISQVGVVKDTGKDDYTRGHTTGTFGATGELQTSNNPDIVDARSDLAVRAENGDL